MCLPLFTLLKVQSELAQQCGSIQATAAKEVSVVCVALSVVFDSEEVADYDISGSLLWLLTMKFDVSLSSN